MQWQGLRAPLPLITVYLKPHLCHGVLYKLIQFLLNVVVCMLTGVDHKTSKSPNAVIVSYDHVPFLDFSKYKLNRTMVCSFCKFRN